VKEFSKKTDRFRSPLKALPINNQKFRTLEVNNLLFIDSCAFLSDALSKLTDTLKASNHEFGILSQWEKNPQRRELLTRKGIYPYSFATSLKRLNQTECLPDIEHFYSDLAQEECSVEDYSYAQSMFKEFECKNMMDYTLLYLRTDVYLLAEAVMNLRSMVYDEFKLDICNYLSLPMLSKDLMLKMTGVEIELISDPEMSNLLQHNIRGGVSYINNRLVTQRSGFSIVYLDANNLYGKAMTFPLPLSDFKWMDQSELQNLRENWKDMIHDQDGTGYILEVSLRYPKKLHIPHNSFPLAPEHLEIDEFMLSPYASKCLNKLTKKKRHNSKKLTATFYDRERYIVHGLNLKLYLEQGLQLLKIHRGISFYQEAFVKPYIDLCSKKRAMAATKSLKDLYKLLCNSLYGKFIENVMKRTNCSPLCQSFKILGENLSVSYLKKPVIRMKQSWAIGFAILELSKFVMQRSYYETVRPKLDNNVSVLMSDTDSWVLQVKEDSCDSVIEKLGDKFMDCSNYTKNHKLYSTRNKAVVGKFKNEVPNATIKCFAGIRAKSYAFDTELKEENTRKCKGVVKSKVRKLTFDDYRDCLENMSILEVTQNQLRSYDHENKMIQCRKQAFSSFDDKRYLLCSIHSVPYGSRLIQLHETSGLCYFCKRPNLLC